MGQSDYCDIITIVNDKLIYFISSDGKTLLFISTNKLIHKIQSEAGVEKENILLEGNYIYKCFTDRV